jgi:predicted metal-binding membrane protein
MTSRRDSRRATVVGLLLGIAALAWLTTKDRMAGMDAGPGTDPGTLGFYVSIWTLMMAAMMLPSVAPMVATYAVVAGRKRSAPGRPEGSSGATAAFVAGYLLAWTAFGLLAYCLYEGLRSLDLDAFGWENAGPYLAAAVVALAALYQLTPLKDACLSRCRNPIGFVVGSWREGRGGALVMGMHHGGWCIGCCWALMAALFAVGVMSLFWMAFVAVLVAAEKLLPGGRTASLAVAAALVALAVGIALDPADVPGLTVPGPAAHSAMMGGAR